MVEPGDDPQSDVIFNLRLGQWLKLSWRLIPARLQRLRTFLPATPAKRGFWISHPRLAVQGMGPFMSQICRAETRVNDNHGTLSLLAVLRIENFSRVSQTVDGSQKRTFLAPLGAPSAGPVAPSQIQESAPLSLFHNSVPKSTVLIPGLSRVLR